MSTAADPTPEQHDHAHHFADFGQQMSAVKLGMWAFLVQELLFFAGLFMAYICARYLYPETFQSAYEYLSIPMGATNTVVLLFSSLTMALAVRAAQLNQNKHCLYYLLATIGCACTFMVIKYFEYTHKIHEGLLPGRLFSGWEMTAEQAVYDSPQLFFGLYFMMTGVHGLHVVIGIGILLWVAWKAHKGAWGSRNYAFVENTGLYWHLVDLIWIFLFPLLYLVK